MTNLSDMTKEKLLAEVLRLRGVSESNLLRAEKAEALAADRHQLKAELHIARCEREGVSNLLNSEKVGFSASLEERVKLLISWRNSLQYGFEETAKSLQAAEAECDEANRKVGVNLETGLKYLAECDTALLDARTAHGLIESLQKECERLREGWLAEERQREEKHEAVKKAGGVYQRLNGEMVLLIVDSPLLKTLEIKLASALSSLTLVKKACDKYKESHAYAATMHIVLQPSVIQKIEASLTSETPPPKEDNKNEIV